MALDFPDAPNNGDTFTSGAATWTYDSTLGAWTRSADEFSGVRTPQTVADTTDALAAADSRRLTMYSNASAVTVTVPTGTFSAGEWFWLQSTGAGGLSLSTAGLTLNGSSPSTAVSQNESLLVIFTASNTISVFGGTA